MSHFQSDLLITFFISKSIFFVQENILDNMVQHFRQVLTIITGKPIKNIEELILLVIPSKHEDD